MYRGISNIRNASFFEYPFKFLTDASPIFHDFCKLRRNLVVMRSKRRHLAEWRRLTSGTDTTCCSSELAWNARLGEKQVRAFLVIALEQILAAELCRDLHENNNSRVLPPLFPSKFLHFSAKSALRPCNVSATHPLYLKCNKIFKPL